MSKSLIQMILCRCHHIISGNIMEKFQDKYVNISTPFCKTFFRTHLIIFSLSRSRTEPLRSTGSIAPPRPSAVWGAAAALVVAVVGLRREKSTGRDSSTNIPKEMSTRREREKIGGFSLC